MTLALLGATGRTGRAVVGVAASQGLSVRALCRPTARLDWEPNVEILRGDLAKAADLDRTIAGAFAVCCVFGPRPPCADVFCAAATRAIVDAMHRTGVRRLVCQTGAVIGPDVPNRTTAMRIIASVFRRQQPAIAEDRDEQERIVKTSDLNWTLVKPPRLTDTPSASRVQAGQDLRVGLLSRIGRVDLAGFLVSECLSPRFERQAVFVAN